MDSYGDVADQQLVALRLPSVGHLDCASNDARLIVPPERLESIAASHGRLLTLSFERERAIASGTTMQKVTAIQPGMFEKRVLKAAALQRELQAARELDRLAHAPLFDDADNTLRPAPPSLVLVLEVL